MVRSKRNTYEQRRPARIAELAKGILTDATFWGRFLWPKGASIPACIFYYCGGITVFKTKRKQQV